MIRIRQHGIEKELNDIISFIPFIEELAMPREWKISVDWCSGERSDEIEKSHKEPWCGSHNSFCKYYKDIYQTIDGNFIVKTDKGVISLIAVDSSYWEIQSDIPGIEEAFENQYGKYESPFNS